MKILFISNYKANLGGISAQVALLQHKLQQEGYTAEIFSTKGNVWQRICHFFALLWTARKYSVLHIHGCSGLGGFLPIVYGVLVGKVLRKRIVVSYHGGEADAFFALHPHFVRFFLQRTHTNIVLSGFLEEVFHKYQLSCVVIPNILEFDAAQYKERTSLQPHFVSVRHLSELYNIPCILEAFVIVQQQIPKATLTLLGEGEQRSMLEDYVEEKGLQHVRFVGAVPNALMYDYLRQTDIMLSAPRIDNMPVSVLEAFNAGVLVISSRVGGVPYMMRENETGLFFSANQPQELAEKMLWALQHQAEAIAMIHKAKADVDKYSWENIKQSLLQVYA